MSSRDTILKHIEEHGASSAKVLGKAARVSRQAAQKAATKLVKEGTLERSRDRDGRGRPTVMFGLPCCDLCYEGYDDSGHCGCVLFPCSLCGMEINKSFAGCRCKTCSFCIVTDSKGAFICCKACYARANPASYAVLVVPRNGSVLVPRLTGEQRDRLTVVKGKIAWRDEVLIATKYEFEECSEWSCLERQVPLSPNDGILYNTTADRFESFDNGQWSPVSAARAGSPSPDYIFVATEKDPGGSS